MTVEVNILDALLGVTLRHVAVRRSTGDGDEVVFTRQDGATLRMYHEQDCCERVWLEDINGNLANLVGAPLVVAEERVCAVPATESDETATATFYELRTRRGGVTMMWRGESSGYYSERVTLDVWEVRDV